MIITGRTINQLPTLSAITSASTLILQTGNTTFKANLSEFAKSNVFGSMYQNLIPVSSNTFTIGTTGSTIKSLYVTSGSVIVGKSGIIGIDSSGNTYSTSGISTPSLFIGNVTSDGIKSTGTTFLIISGDTLIRNQSGQSINLFKQIVPTGGTTSQVLAKSSNNNYDFNWLNLQGIYITGATSNGGGLNIYQSATTSTLAFKTITSQTPTHIIISDIGGLLSISGTGILSITNNGAGAFVAQSGTSSSVALRSLSSQTPSYLSINASGELMLFSSNTANLTTSTISNLNYIDFNTGATQSPAFGRVYFDGTEQALTYYGQTNTPVRIGQQLYSRVINSSGVLIPKGTAVKITGSTSTLPAITPAIASHLGDNRVAGITVLDIANGATGLIITKGLFSGLTLNNYSVGDSLFLSPFSAGTYTSSTTSFPFNSRVNRLGRVVTTGTTTGQIFVDISNEDNTLSLTSIERNILEGNVISTGTYEYTGLTTGSTNTTFNVAPLRGWIVQNTYEYATEPEVDNIYYTGGTNIPVTNIATADATYLLINTASTLYQQTTFPTPQQRRENIFIGKVVHPNRSTILALNNTVDFDVSPMSALRDLWTPIKLVNDGIFVSPNTGLTFNMSSGKLWGNGIGWASNQLNPNSVNISSKVGASFFYRTRTGGTSSAVTNIDPTKYDVNGVITSMGTAGVDDASNQRIYLYPTGILNVLYGQTKYTNLAAAVAGIQSESFVTYPNASTTGILIGILSVRNDIVNDNKLLSDTDYAVFTPVSKFGELLGGTAGLSTTTLQQAYNNSTTPEIITTTTLGAVSIQNGAGANTLNIFEGQNSGGTTTSFIKADGTISGLTFLGDGSQLSRYYGSFYSTSAMTAANTTTAYVMSANTTGVNNGVILSSGSRIVMQSAGTYDIKYSAQLIKTSGSPSSSTVSIWLRKNGTDIQNTNAEFDITKITANNGKTVASFNYIDTFTAGQYIEFVWSTTSTDVTVGNIGAQANPTRPTTPSLYVVVRQV